MPVALLLRPSRRFREADARTAARDRLHHVLAGLRDRWAPPRVPEPPDDDRPLLPTERDHAEASDSGEARSVRRTRLGMDGPAAAGVALVAALAVLLAVAYVWRGRPEPVEPARTVATATAEATPSPTPTPSPVVVDVAGKVRDPGVFTLPSGSRVVDAVEAAGGARRGADTTTLNLARVLTDGEQVLVGAPSSVAAPTAAPGAPGSPLVDLNTASTEQLEELPGVGPVLAERIIEHRTSVGGFTSVDELQEVSGIGEQRMADLRDLVQV